MAKPSSYIEKKNSALFDMYAELQIAQKSKMFKDGDTTTVRAVPCLADALMSSSDTWRSHHAPEGVPRSTGLLRCARALESHTELGVVPHHTRPPDSTSTCQIPRRGRSTRSASPSTPTSSASRCPRRTR